MNLPERGEVVIDASGHIMGRLASHLAKALLTRPELRIIVINIEKAVVVGERKVVVGWFMRKAGEWRTHYNPEKVGPKVPRRPDRIFKRVVRGMLPKNESGRRALKRLRVYMSIPIELLQRKKLVTYTIPAAMFTPRPLLRYVTLEEIWRSVDYAAWEQWERAQEVWAKKIKQADSS
ncbi:MAG: 50S ribosomal protein L13 [Pyrobaculum sp.]